MSGRLILARMKRERIHVETWIRWRAYVRSSELVWDVRVEEVGREYGEEINRVRYKVKRGNVRSFTLDVKVARRTKNARRRNRAVGDLTETMPVFHVRRNNRCLATDGRYVGVGATVDRWLETEHEGFNWPFELDKMDAVGALVQVLSLTTVDTYKRECYTVNEDVVYFWEYEHVVNVQVEGRNLWGR